MIGGRSAAPVRGSVRWVLGVLILWQVLEILGRSGPTSTGGWPVGPFELLHLLLVLPLFTLAFARLFLAVTQSSYGSLNTYTLTASPLAWIFWAGSGLALAGQGVYATAHLLSDAVPEVVSMGEYGEMVRFFDTSLGFWMFGVGFTTMSLVILVLGQGSTQRVVGPERTLLIIGSLLTYGSGILFFGVEERHLVPAIICAALLVAPGLRYFSLREVGYDPVSLLVIPGAATGGLILFAWALLVGGQPSWPW
ncbi:MAG: hypothetical protein KKA32_01850 [Actinobacteria bacterium]|nr:hypothetical protein [Actinomycetota bacterium]